MNGQDAVPGLVLGVLAPWADPSHTEGLEVLDVSCRNGHLLGPGDRGDERVVQRRVLRNRVGSKDSCGREVEGQYPACEGRQNANLEPSAQNLPLGRVGSLLDEHPTFDLRHGRGGHELIGHPNRCRPILDEAIASPYS